MGKKGPCFHCGINSTPLWRHGPPEKPVLCNACGSRYRMRGSLDDYAPKHLNKAQILGNLKPVDSKCKFDFKSNTLSHASDLTTTASNNSTTSDSTISAEGNNNEITPSFWSSPVPKKKRSVAIYRDLTEMEKFHMKLLSLWRFDKLRNGTTPEEVLIHNVNSFTPSNEIGLGCMLLEPDIPSSKKEGSVGFSSRNEELPCTYA